jgi:hypothetical protein
MKPNPNQPPAKPTPKKSGVNYLMIVGAVVAVQASAMTASGPATSALKLFGCFGGAACCLVGMAQMVQSKES